MYGARKPIHWFTKTTPIDPMGNELLNISYINIVNTIFSIKIF